MSLARRFSKPVLAAIDAGKILGIRAGLEPHRFIGVWVVVVNQRVFVRSWNDRRHGWHRLFLEEPRGVMQIAEREIRVRARRTTGARLLDAIDLAYAHKYHTPGARHYVRGLCRPRRRSTTTELLPR